MRLIEDRDSSLNTAEISEGSMTPPQAQNEYYRA